MEIFETETRQIYEVSEVTRIVKSILENSPVSTLWIQGEVSNFSQPASGHLYFTLKDSNSQIKCAIFRPAADRLRSMLEDGASIVLYGRLSVYEPRGEYQIIGTRVEPLGVGALQLAFEELKKRLQAEGLFDTAHKKPIPLVPQRVGVVTSPTGAAIRDILNVIGRRFSNVSVLIHPVTVQGEGSGKQIAAAIETMNQRGGLDVLIVGRGGGSAEDLWAFNEEVVARSIYASEIPVISAVGHEIDFTIADFVADFRAPTPSAAAEMVVANKADLVRSLEGLNTRLRSSIDNRVQLLKRRLEGTQYRLLSRDGRDRIHQHQQNIDDLLQRCAVSIQHLLKTRKDRFGKAIAELNALSPLAILQRGYSVCFRHPSRELVKSAAEVSVGDKVEVKLANGEIICEVERALTEFLF
jgi:exodeoxyribonuclease VII large subunit